MADTEYVSDQVRSASWDLRLTALYRTLRRLPVRARWPRDTHLEGSRERFMVDLLGYVDGAWKSTITDETGPSTEIKRKRAFRKFSYRGIDLDQLLDLSSEQLRDVVHARARRRFNRGLKRKPMGLIKKLRKAKQEAKPNEKPDLVKTHLRDMIVVPEMIGSVIGIYSGKEFNQVEIKPEMVGHYLAEFSIS
ncbi:ribosomal protein S15 [Microsporum canis]